MLYLIFLAIFSVHIEFTSASSLLKYRHCNILIVYRLICIWNVALYGSGTWAVEKNEEKIINAFETCSWGRMLKLKWTDRIANDEVFKGPNKKDF